MSFSILQPSINSTNLGNGNIYYVVASSTMASFFFTLKGHRQKVNSVKFSPDGQWIASAGEEGAVKVRPCGTCST